ncbi:putative pyruvate dehydrogenase E1 component alpha subunit [Aspergillus saccharolyticus JOP 1030-1]|uniref:Pyruvate dehydrogenase E1 component subunit alpha n=1 Tax=Aspergillus saccharolyticus JOP 1030-1 TaxID=1450539 RepID=A0A318ZIF4_9EURO|nr:pyruvate dehydrogenase E1 component subunit alpha [Aspergillus saccharolyticus JOP 1030-1]PYH46557.1 pyruvate dehydrogenase E1 component subunit alpha [Aspergillus saccharolyticus JOP 1030-1]
MTMLSYSLKVKTALPWTRLCYSGRRCMAHVANIAADDIPTGDDQPFKVSIAEDSYETYNLEPPPYTLETTKRQLKQLYHDMFTIRRMELAADRFYKEGKIRGFCHLSIGQEAVTVGIEHGISREDKLITAYRSHGTTLMRGATVKSILGELLGRQEGISHGRGGSIHMFRENFFGGNGIVGAHVPVGAGIAFAQQYHGNRDTVTVDIFGDGAANQGQVHEAFNMAKLWNLPIIFCCENNKYGMGTSVERSSAMTEYYKRGQYLPGLRINGMDVLAVLAAMRYGKEFVQAGNGPLLYEYQTYRFAGHSVSDPGTTYRSREEIQAERRHDPLSVLQEQLAEWGVLSKEEVKAIEKDVRSKVDREAEEANHMPVPEPRLDVLFRDIYVPGSEPLQRRGRTIDETYY